MIYFIPLSDRNTASSRLRVYNIQPYIPNSKIGIPEKYQKGDVLVIQKILAYEEMKKAQSQGAKVIYDIDDYYWDKPDVVKMIREADMVTVDTDKKAAMLSYDNVVRVIPDSLDWDGTKKTEYKNEGIVGWTGYGNNSHNLNGLELPEGMKLRLITDPTAFQHCKKKFQIRPWSLNMVDKYLAECDLGVYYLEPGQWNEVKGMHKLLKNWAIGIPTYTSPIPDYIKAMEEAGVGHKYLIARGDQIKPVKFEEKLRKYALKYSAENVAKIWNKTIKSFGE